MHATPVAAAEKSTGGTRVRSKMDAYAGVASLLILALITWSREIAFCAAQSQTSRLLFEENFNSRDANNLFWSREIKIPLEPDYEFCVYHKHENTMKIDNGVLRIKPSLLEDDYGENAVLVGQLRLADCTSTVPEECFRHAMSYHILPPVISARLITRNLFEFRYGIIVVRAKFPEGDWLYPEILLEAAETRGRRSGSSRIVLGRARGNEALTRRGKGARDELGGKLLEFGLANGTGAELREHTVPRVGREAWTKGFHVYKTRWSPQGFTFYVDDQEVGSLVPVDGGYWSADAAVEATGDMAPYDQKFYLSIGLGVGGINVFPDETQTDTYVKPWKNSSPKAMLRFWQAKSSWLPTWQQHQGANTALEVDYVRIYSLD